MAFSASPAEYWGAVGFAAAALLYLLFFILKLVTADCDLVRAFGLLDCY